MRPTGNIFFLWEDFIDSACCFQSSLIFWRRWPLLNPSRFGKQTISDISLWCWPLDCKSPYSITWWNLILPSQQPYLFSTHVLGSVYDGLKQSKQHVRGISHAKLILTDVARCGCVSKYFSQRSFADKNRALSKYSGGKYFSVRSSLGFGKQNHQNFGICSSEEI